MSEEKKKRKRNVPSYSLKLRLLTSEEDECLLDKRFSYCNPYPKCDGKGST